MTFLVSLPAEGVVLLSVFSLQGFVVCDPFQDNSHGKLESVAVEKFSRNSPNVPSEESWTKVTDCSLGKEDKPASFHCHRPYLACGAQEMIGLF